jgi:hypothetical protein
MITIFLLHNGGRYVIDAWNDPIFRVEEICRDTHKLKSKSLSKKNVREIVKNSKFNFPKEFY